MNKELDEIAQKYAVNVGFGTIKGSGVLVKSENNTCYLFTAKHNFKREEDNTHKDVKKEYIESIVEKIYIEKVIFDNTKVYMNELIFFEDDLDLVVFLLEKNELSFIKELSQVAVFKDKLSKKYDYFFYGYPKSAEDGFLSHGKYNLHKENDKNIFYLVDIDKQVDDNAVSGYSGSGVFLNIKGTEEVYLVGMVIIAEEGLSYFEIIDLGKIIDRINLPIQIANSDGVKPNKINEYHLIIECIPKNEKFEVIISTYEDNRMIETYDENSYTKDELASLIDTYIENNKPDDDDKKVFLSFVLPISLMSENIGNWKVGKDTLGEKYTIILRGQERFRNRNKHQYASFNKWDKNWKNCEKKADEKIKKVIYEKYEITDDKISDSKIQTCPLMIFGYNIQAEMFEKLYRRGISRAIWVGENTNLKKFKKLFKNKKHKNIQNIKFGKLHDNLYEFTEQENQIGSHIMFLYDDPNKLPLDDSDMAQITPII